MLLKLAILFIYSAIFICAMDLRAGKFRASKAANGKTFYAVTDRTNFFGAFVGCQEAGMNLATVKTATEESVLEELLVSYGVNVSWTEGFWLSGSNLPDTTKSAFYWLNGGSKVIFADWIPGEPNNSSGTEHCLMFAAYKSYRGWNDYTCSNHLRYVCEITQE